MQVKRNYNLLEKFNELFLYDEDSPSGLVWKTHKTKVGNPVGRKLKVRGKEKYWVVDILKECYVVHRVIWIMHNGNNSISEYEEIDHLDQNGLNNRLSNLRAVTRSVNSKNRKLRSDNLTGLNGIIRITRNSELIGYRAEIVVNGEAMGRSFNFSVHGEIGSWESAVEYRNVLLKLDGSYTNLHGT